MLRGKLSFVTGAASGIGRATCILMANEGCKVIAADCNSEPLSALSSSLLGEGHMVLDLDVSNAKMVSDTFKEVVRTYSKPPDILINAAGIIRDNFLLNLPEGDFQEVLNVNLKGTFLTTQKFCATLIEAQKPGSIVNVSSVVGKKGNRGQSNYAASKAGVIAFTKSIAMEMSKNNIRCNTVVPGFIDTPMTENVPDKVKEIFKMLIPCGRFGKPEEVAEVIAFLASDKSSYVNGTEVYVTGGFE